VSKYRIVVLLLATWLGSNQRSHLQPCWLCANRVVDRSRPQRPMTAPGPGLPTCALRQVGSYLRYSGPSNHVVVTLARGSMRSIENRLTLTMPRRGRTQQCGSANSSKPLCIRQRGHLVWMAGMATSQYNLPTASCRHDRVSIDMEIRSCLKKSSFPEPLRDIEQLVEQRERYLVHLRETGARRPTLRSGLSRRIACCRASGGGVRGRGWSCVLWCELG